MAFYGKTHWLQFLLVFAVQLFVIVVLGLAHSENWHLLVYLLAVGTLLLIGCFLLDYFRKRRWYDFLSGKSSALLRGDTDKESRLIFDKVNSLLQKQEDQILQSTRAREQQVTFMNLWTHQMKTPISVLEMMAQENQLDSVEVLRETQRLKSGLNLALNEARLIGGMAQDFTLQQLSLEKVVNAAVNQQKNFFIQHQVFPEVKISEKLVVISDEKWLQFVLEQILINSIKYSKAGSKVTLTGTSSEGAPILRIVDHGVGIPPADLPRVKRPFFTGENGRKFGEATGMGLYLVDQVSEELGIAFAIDSTVGEGTQVTLRFPDDGLQ